MASPVNSRAPVSTASVAEFTFLIIVIWLMAGPISGIVLSAQSWISSVFAHGAYQVESTKNLANQLLDASDRIKTLETKLAKAQLELVTLRQQTRESNKLRGLLGLKQRQEPKALAAEVIARTPDHWFEQVELDKGRLDGVLKGAGVITAEGVVGQVIRVDDHASVVRLLTDPDEKVGVVIEHSGVNGILSGQYEKTAKLDFVPQGTNVERGEKIFTLGKGSIFPKNHPVGTIIAVNRDAGGAALKIDVKLSENCYDLSQVLVLSPQDETEDGGH